MYYSDIRKQLKTGDVVLFSGKGRISRVIRWFTRSAWSHVGMVVKSEDYDMLLLWESTTLSKIKTVHGVETQGVAIRPLSEVVNNYEGEIGIRQLKKPLTDVQIETLIEFRREVKGRPYEQDKLELFKSAYDGIFGGNDEDLSSIFCSELIAEFFKRAEIIPDYADVPSNEYTPADFGTLWSDEFTDIIILDRG